MEVSGLCSQAAEWSQHGWLCAVIFRSGRGCAVFQLPSLGNTEGRWVSRLTAGGGGGSWRRRRPCRLSRPGGVPRGASTALCSGRVPLLVRAVFCLVSGQASLRILLPWAHHHVSARLQLSLSNLVSREGDTRSGGILCSHFLEPASHRVNDYVSTASQYA